MARTVEEAFEIFMRNTIRLEPEQLQRARSSRNNLVNNINMFSGDSDFFRMLGERHLKYGSFARKTKIRPLDDIDLMICLSADGRKYEYREGTYLIYGNETDSTLLANGSQYISSVKILNRFMCKLRTVHDYAYAEMHRNHEAVTLKLRSYDWNFDIVPCWHMDIDKYLIPDGFGNWKITDPRIDNYRTTNINQKHKGKLLDIIRLTKYWNRHSNTYTIGSYLLECMILEAYREREKISDYLIEFEFASLMFDLSRIVLHSVDDPKCIQGDLNTYTYEGRNKISQKMEATAKMVIEAIKLNNYNETKAAIKIWRQILGNEFPDYM